MKILVTGGSGFIGSNLVHMAVKRGHKVINFDKLTYSSCLKNLEGLEGNPNYIFEKADICDRLAVDKILETHQPDIIMHLAAESHVDRSIVSPSGFIESNIFGTYTLLDSSLEYWRSSGKPSSFLFHHISTDEVYGTLGEDGSFNEQTPYAPNSPYSASKAASDHLVQAWHKTYKLPTVITNCTNNYGPFQFPEKLVPLVILNALNGRPIPIYGNGKNVRDWLFVEDHVEALLLVCENGTPGRKYNIGSGNQRRNIDFVCTICALLDERRPENAPHDKLITHVEDRAGHDYRYAVDATRISDELGWEPKITEAEGLARTIDWYLTNSKWWPPLQRYN